MRSRARSLNGLIRALLVVVLSAPILSACRFPGFNSSAAPQLQPNLTLAAQETVIRLTRDAIETGQAQLTRQPVATGQPAAPPAPPPVAAPATDDPSSPTPTLSPTPDACLTLIHLRTRRPPSGSRRTGLCLNTAWCGILPFGNKYAIRVDHQDRDRITGLYPNLKPFYGVGSILKVTGNFNRPARSMHCLARSHSTNQKANPQHRTGYPRHSAPDIHFVSIHQHAHT
jgi:hypothetical protein